MSIGYVKQNKFKHIKQNIMEGTHHRVSPWVKNVVIAMNMYTKGVIVPKYDLI